MLWPDDIPFIQDGKPADQANLNAPVQALAHRTDYLKTILDSLTNKSNLIAFAVNTETSVEEGDLVYFDGECGVYKRALALWDSEYSVKGEILAAPSAYTKGWVIKKHTTSTADILLNGLYTDASLTVNLLGENPVPGVYYLSATEAGKATLTPPPLKVPAISYVGNDTIIFKPTDVFQPNHLHRSLILRGAWYPVSDSRFDGMDIPAWAVMGYDIESDPAFQEWFASYPGALTVFLDGILQEDTKMVTSLDNLWWLGEYGGSSSSSASYPANNSSSSSITSSSDDYMEGPNEASSVVVFAYNPFTQGEPVVRGVTTETPCELQVTSANGVVTINAADWEMDDTALTGKAVVCIKDKHMKVAPVVTSITSSGGVTVAKGPLGRYDVSTGDVIEALRDAELVNLNNAIERTDEPYFYYILPEERESSIIGKVSIPTLNPANTYKAAVWVYRKGITGATAGTPLPYPELNVEMTHVASPKDGVITMPPAPQIITTLAEEPATEQDKLYYAETPVDDRIIVTKEGTVYIKIAVPANSYNKYITRFGVIIYLDAGDGPVVTPCGT